jgi:predicted amidohydrolase
MKIGAAQIKLSTSISRNVANISRWLRLAAEQGLEILNFPETSLTGYVYEAFAQIKPEDIKQGLNQIGQLIQELKINAVIGTPLWMGGEFFNSVVVFMANGQRLHYHKSNLVDFEKAYFKAGSEVLTFQVGELTFGVIVCRDQNNADLSLQIRKRGAHVLFISCAHYYHPNEARLKVEKNRALPIVRAYENGMFVCKANAVGTYKGQINLGHSIIVGPNGTVLAEAGETEEALLCFEIDERNLVWKW